MTTYIALNIAYAALLLCGVALLLMWRRIRKIEKVLFKTIKKKQKVTN